MYDPDKSARLAAEAAEAMVGVTPGEWAVTSSTGDIHSQARRGQGWICQGPNDSPSAPPIAERKANARFIAWSRTGVPAVAAALQDANAEVVRLREALNEAKRQIRVTVEQATDIMRDLGRDCDPAERTYGPIIARIELLETGHE